MTASTSAPPERLSITARDGSVYEFFIEPGRLASESSGKFSDATTARHTHPDGSVSSFSWNEFDDRFQIASISLRPQMRGAGVGLELYRHLAERAVSAGKRFESDSTVSSEALKIYPRLEAMGYQVRYADDQNVAAFDHQQRDENDTSRPPGSQQFLGRDERPIAVVVGRSDGSSPDRPQYLQRLLDKPAADSSMSLAGASPPPLPQTPAPRPEPAGQDWWVALAGEPERKTIAQLRELLALDRLGSNTLARPAETPGEWAPAGFHPELLGLIQRAKAPSWHIARAADPANPNAQRSFGPYTEQEICKYAARGLIKASDSAWAPGMSAWAPIDSTRAGELARLGRENAQAFSEPVDLAGSLAARRQALQSAPAEPRQSPGAGPR